MNPRFKDILKNIKKEFEVRVMTSTYAQIEFDILFDDYNYLYIGVLSKDDGAILTDMANYSELDYWQEEDLPEVEKICQRFGITFHNWHIECPYNDNEDIKRYQDCLLALKDRFVEED